MVWYDVHNTCRVPVAASMDIRNPFNLVDWVVIHAALKHMDFPLYEYSGEYSGRILVQDAVHV